MAISIQDSRGRDIYTGPERRNNSYGSTEPVKIEHAGPISYVWTKVVVRGEDRRKGRKKMVLEFDYINHKGESGHRRAQMEGVRFGSSPWHQEPQWLMRALDLDKKEYRDFALRDMTNIKEVP